MEPDRAAAKNLELPSNASTDGNDQNARTTTTGTVQEKTSANPRGEYRGSSSKEEGSLSGQQDEDANLLLMKVVAARCSTTAASITSENTSRTSKNPAVASLASKDVADQDPSEVDVDDFLMQVVASRSASAAADKSLKSGHEETTDLSLAKREVLTYAENKIRRPAAATTASSLKNLKQEQVAALLDGGGATYVGCPPANLKGEMLTYAEEKHRLTMGGEAISMQQAPSDVGSQSHTKQSLLRNVQSNGAKKSFLHSEDHYAGPKPEGQIGAFAVSTGTGMTTTLPIIDDVEEGRPPQEVPEQQPTQRNDNTPHAADNSNRGLAVAMEVADGESNSNLQNAREVSAASKQQAQQTDDSKGMMTRWLLMGLTVLVIAAVILLLILVLQDSEDQEGTPSLATSLPTTTQAPSLSLEDHVKEYVLSLLPPHSVDAIMQVEQQEDDAETPQSMAFQFIIRDPNLISYPSWRILQRFALATLFYATGGGDVWFETTDWLSYDVHECDWFAGWAINDDYGGINANITIVEAPFHTPCELDPAANATTTNDDPNVGVFKHISLGVNNLQGIIPEELYLLTSLRSIMLVTNFLVGTLSTRLGQLTKLEALDVANNQMTGPIPTEIGLLTDMTRAYILINEFTGTIPTEFGLLTGLVDFMLARNNLVGPLPTEIGTIDADSLTRLWLHENQLNGTIPTEMKSLSGLEHFWIEHNALSGLIPPEIGWLASDGNLSSFQCVGNELSGAVPDALCYMDHSDLVDMNCTTSRLCGCDCPC